MRQQIAFEYAQTQNGQRLIQRRTIAPPGQGTYYQQANPHRAGHFAGLHDESAPFQSDDLDTYTQPPARTMPRSAIRYRPLAPAQQQPTPKPRRHWLFYVGIALFVMIIGWIALTAIGNWWQMKMDDLRYGFPRTFQIDQNVGHFNYSSHFVALNLNGKIEIIETEPQNPNAQQATHMYIAATLTIDQSLQPVTLKFEDLTGHGRLDMLVLVGNSLQVPLYNNGASFQTQPPSR